MSSVFNRIYFQIKFELSNFKNHLKKLEVPNYPTSVAKIVLSFLYEKMDRYEEITEKIFEDKNEGGEYEAKRKLIVKVHNPLIQQDVKFLNWLKESQTANVPWSFIPCIDELAKHILPEEKIIVYSENTYNYGICWSQTKNVAPHPFLVIALPRLHRTNILWHALVGHELFHPRCSEFINKYNQEVLSNIRELISHKFRRKQNETKDDLFSEQEEKETLLNLSDGTHRAWRRAFEELLSDMACVEIFGPAAILAMRAFSSCSPQNDMPDPDNNFYPSWQYRLETVWDNIINEDDISMLTNSIKDEGVKSSFCQQINDIRNVVSSKEGQDLVQKHPQAKIAYDEVKRLLPYAVKFVKDEIPQSIQKWNEKDTIQQIPYLIQRLYNAIPPNELFFGVPEDAEEEYITKIPTITAIFNAGWIYTTYWEDNYKKNDSLMSYNTLSKLILKSLDDYSMLKP